jgi:hypothetical protein
MRFYNLLIALFVFSCLASCKKSGDAGPVTLVAKWSLVNDSTAFGGALASPLIKKNYVGVPGDYFDFRADGKLYIKEGAKYDTLAYNMNMTAGDSVIINNFNYNNYPSVIKPITAHNASIYSTFMVFEIYYFRKVNLKK